MEEPEPKDDTLKENQEAVPEEAITEPAATKRKTLVQTIREKVEAVPGTIKEGASKTAQFVKDHRGEIITGAAVVIGILGAIAKTAIDEADNEYANDSFSNFDSSEEDEPHSPGSTEPEHSESDLVADDPDESASDSKTVYSTNEWKGYGKQNYSHYEYRVEDDQVVRYKCRRFKYFNGEENEWVKSEGIDKRWDLDDPDMPEWLPQYLPDD